MIACRKTILIHKSKINTPERKLWATIFGNYDGKRTIISLPKTAQNINFFTDFTTKRIGEYRRYY